MKKIKNVSLAIISVLLFICSSIIFVGCKDDEDTGELFVFATKGGYVQVNDSKDYVQYGDEGSKSFTFTEDAIIKLKATANEGYDFVKWEWNEDFDGIDEKFDSQPQISFIADDDEIVIRAVFALNGTISYTINYPTNTTGYTIVPEYGYSTTVMLGGEFKFKVNLLEDYSNSEIVVKTGSKVLSPNSKGVYTITNVTQNLNIVVEGVTLNTPETIPTYTISTKDNEYAIIPISDNDCVVDSGSSFTFRLQLEDGYKYGNSVVVRANGVIITPNNGKYTISSVTEDIEIKVEGIVEISTFVVTLPSSTKYRIVDKYNSVFNQAQLEIEENEVFEFKVNILDNTNVKDIVVRANGTRVIPNNNIYTIVVGVNITITVEIIQMQTFTYSFDLEFEDGVENLIDLEMLGIPNSITFSIDEDEMELSEYDATKFIVTDSYGEQMTIMELVERINSIADFGLGFSALDYFAIRGNTFIMVDSYGTMTINWELLTQNQNTYTIEVILL